MSASSSPHVLTSRAAMSTRRDRTPAPCVIIVEMGRRFRIVCVLAGVAASGCNGQVTPPTGGDAAKWRSTTLAPGSAGPLVEDVRWSMLAVPIAFAHDGRRWVGGDERELVVYEDDREVDRIHVGVALDDALFALSDGGWVAGARILAADRTVRFDGHAYGQRFGMFGSAKAMAVSADGAVAIVAGADSPSACGPDCPPGSSRGALTRFSFGRGAPIERVLVEHDDGRRFEVAASSQWVAASERRTLSVWPATGDGPATVVEVEDLDRLLPIGDRWLVAKRFVDAEHSEVIVFDRDADWARSVAWTVEGTIHAIAVRPTTNELAIATTWYRARTKVEVDEKRVELYALDGTRVARVDVERMPQALAWSPRGDALLVATTGTRPEEHTVLRLFAH
jgi:hypothetical protein